MSDPARNLESLKAALDGICRNPLRLRASLAVVLAATWYLAVYRPTVERLEVARQRLETEGKRLELAESIESLKAQVQRFHDRLPPRADPNEAVHHLLEGVRALPVRLISLDPGQSRDFGPYKAVVVRLKAEGTYANLDKMLRWIETNPRMLRVDTISLAPLGGPARAGDDDEPRYSIEMEITGVIG